MSIILGLANGGNEGRGRGEFLVLEKDVANSTSSSASVGEFLKNLRLRTSSKFPC